MNTFEVALADYQNVQWLDYTQNLMDSQKDIFHTNQMFDVLIGVGQQRFKAHKLVLCASSDFLKDVLASSGNACHHIPTILIPDLNPKLVEPLLEFMYTGEAFVNSFILSEFLEACSFLQIKGFISYDCLVNGIRLQQDPNKQTAVVVPEDADENGGNKDTTLVLPHQTFEIIPDDVLIENEDYSIKDYTIEEDDVTCKSNENLQNHEQILGGEGTSEEYLEEDVLDEMLIAKIDTKRHFEVDEDNKFIPKKRPVAYLHWSRQQKSYTEASLNEAIKEIRAGATVVEASAKFDVPRSTIYSKLRQSKDPVYRKYRASHLEDAARLVTEQGISLKEASQLFDVSKTVLWRTLKKCANYKPEERFHSLRADAIMAIQKGDTLISISKRFNIPLATLHRDKVRLHTEGKLPENCKLTRRESGTSYHERLRAAIQSCRNGMAQKMASDLHKVPKTTIWRHLQRFNRMNAAKKEIDDEQIEDPLHQDDIEIEEVEPNESIEILNHYEEDIDTLDFEESEEGEVIV